MSFLKCFGVALHPCARGDYDLNYDQGLVCKARVAWGLDQVRAWGKVG